MTAQKLANFTNMEVFKPFFSEGKPCNESRQLQPVAAFLSSEYVDPKNKSLSHNFTANKCIDGITDGPDSGNPGDDICHTGYSTPSDPRNFPWLAIDFGVEVFVKKVVLFNRRECCYSRTRNVTISTSNVLPNSDRNRYYEGSWFDSFAGPGEPGQQIELTNPLGIRDEAGRYVIVRIREAEEPLNLKEVVAFGYENTPGMKICERRFG